MSATFDLRSYAIVTGAYWTFTVTDGALRMLVLLHFHDLGYSAVTLGFLFVLYEVMGVGTNLVGGWLGTRHGLNRTLHAGLLLQVAALLALSAQNASWPEAVSVVFVMSAQALSGVAKDLTKMSSKSAVKLVVGGADEAEHQSSLFRWVAVLTGSKNALKGVGFFVGGGLLQWLGFDGALWVMAALVASAFVASRLALSVDIGRSKAPPPRPRVLSSSQQVNRLAVARLFLFASRDVWFVVALPVFLDENLGWSFSGIGAFMASWVIGYGIVQSRAPQIARRSPDTAAAALTYAIVLAAVAATIATLLSLDVTEATSVIVGLIVFGIVFAVNSSIHSYLILAYTTDNDVAMDVGFYYSANAMGRLAGTVLSGVAYLAGGLTAALWTSAASLLLTVLATQRLDDPTATAR